MKKIVFVNPFFGYPVPSLMGGGVEELLTILLNENEKKDSDLRFYFVQRQLYGEDKKYLTGEKYKNSEIVVVKYNRIINFFQRAISKLLKFFKFKKKFPTYLALDYHKKAFKEVKKINPDIIIFESQIDAYNKKYIKQFGKDKLYVHIHIQDIDKTQLNNYVNGAIFVSDFIKKDYEDYLGDKAKTLNNYVLKNCVDQDRFNNKISSAERKSVRESLGFGKDDFVVCYCGRICAEKGVDKLIDAVLKTKDNIKLLIMGGLSSAKTQTSPYLRNIENIVNNNPDKLKFTGYIKNKELYKYYQSCDLQVVPSMWEEAAGLVAIEGQICGCPQIITKSGGMIEYASEKTIILNRSGDFVEKLASEIESLANNSVILKEIGQAGIKNSQSYYKEKYYQNFCEIIDKEIR